MGYKLMKETLQKGILGVGGTSAGYVVSLTQAELWLRVLSLTIGIAVGIASLISICMTIQRKWKRRKAELLMAKEESTTV